MPPILEGRDIIASAQTGTGKTAAFLLPMLSKLIKHRHEGHTSGVIIVPTRELAIQIAQHVEGLAYFTPVSSYAIYGGVDGQAFVLEKQALRNGVDLVIATPGKLIAHLNMGYVDFSQLQFLVLDEADRMLDMGFSDDIMRIIKYLPANRQSLLFSATMPEKIRSLARKILTNPVEVNIAISKPPEKVQQKAYVVYEPQKIPLIQHIIRETPHRSLIIFCSRKQTVKQLTQVLKRARFNVAEIHSDLEQSEREDLLQGFRSGRIPVIVATDVLSRGIDIDTIDVVVNYDVPHDAEDYVHRIGRTARAERDGKAFTLVSDKEIGRFARIESLIGKEVEKAVVPAELGEAPAYEPHRRQRGGSGGGRGRQGGERRNGQRNNSERNSGERRNGERRNEEHRNEERRGARPAHHGEQRRPAQNGSQPAMAGEQEAVPGTAPDATNPDAQRKKKKKNRKKKPGGGQGHRPAGTITGPAGENGVADVVPSAGGREE